MADRHPMQPIEVAADGVVRFKANSIIEHLFRSRQPLDLNELAVMDFPDEDRAQIAMLLGYSVSGFGDLGYADPEVVAEADAIAAEVYNAKTDNDETDNDEVGDTNGA